MATLSGVSGDKHVGLLPGGRLQREPGRCWSGVYIIDQVPSRSDPERAGEAHTGWLATIYLPSLPPSLPPSVRPSVRPYVCVI